MFFYANNDLLASPRPARIQAALYVFMGLFDRVVLHTNVNKKVGMVCKPCNIVGGHLEYTWWIMGVGPYFWYWQQERVRYPEYKMKLVAGLLEDQHQLQ